MLIKVMMNKATLGNPLIFASINRMAGKKNIGPILKVLATMYQKHPCVTFCLIKEEYRVPLAVRQIYH
jgi:hypothetical protein